MALNTDLSLFGNPSESGFGGVVRYSDGRCCLGLLGILECLNVFTLS